MVSTGMVRQLQKIEKEKLKLKCSSCVSANCDYHCRCLCHKEEWVKEC